MFAFIPFSEFCDHFQTIQYSYSTERNAFFVELYNFCTGIHQKINKENNKIKEKSAEFGRNTKDKSIRRIDIRQSTHICPYKELENKQNKMTQ